MGLGYGTKVTNSVYATRSLEAVAMACSGAEIAMALPLTANRPCPFSKERLGRLRATDARITGEAGRINLNWVAAGIINGDVSARNCSENFWKLRASIDDRERMMDCLKIGWILITLSASTAPRTTAVNERRTNRWQAGRREANPRLGRVYLAARLGRGPDLKERRPATRATIDIRWGLARCPSRVARHVEGQVDRFTALRRGPR